MTLLLLHSCGVLAFGSILVYKLRQLRACNWSNARLWALTSASFCGAVASLTAVPQEQVVLAAATGIPNVGQISCAVASVAGGASLLVLALLWRYPYAEARSRVRWVIIIYAIDIIAMTVMFAVADVPLERPHLSFAVYYVPRETSIFIYYLLFFVPYLLALCTLAAWCLTWAREDDLVGLPRLRRGLFFLGSMALALVVNIVVYLVSVLAARFSGILLMPVVLVVMVIALLVVMVLFPIGMINPEGASPWMTALDTLSRWRAFHTLRPLHRALRQVSPADALVNPNRKRDARHRVRRMVIELSDWRWRLTPLFTPDVAQRAEQTATSTGLTGIRLRAAIEAAQLKAALHAWQDGHRPGKNDQEMDPGEIRDGRDIDIEITWWLQVARAFRKLPTTPCPLPRAQPVTQAGPPPSKPS